MLDNVLVMIDEISNAKETDYGLAQELETLLENADYQAFNMATQWQGEPENIKYERANAIIREYLRLNNASKVIYITVEDNSEKNTIVTKDNRVYYFKTSFTDVEEIIKQLELYIEISKVQSRTAKKVAIDDIARLLTGRYAQLRTEH
jgi:hypothetical protein